MHRRQLLIGAASLAVALAAPAIVHAKTRLRLGYLHVVAVDGQIWTGLDRGSFERNGIDFELSEFNTGPEVFEALAAGKVDVMSAGGVISNYLALGAGRAFLINDIEIATAQLWVRPDLGVRTFADLRGKRIATITKTTAHIFLDRALRANSIDASEVEVRNSSMSAAVASFIAGEVPAVALWVPFNITVREKVPAAIKLVDASAFYPQSAVLGGWVAGHDYYNNNRTFSPGSFAAGRTPMTISFATAPQRLTPCRKAITAMHRLPISPKRSRRRRCIHPGSGSDSIPTAPS